MDENTWTPPPAVAGRKKMWLGIASVLVLLALGSTTYVLGRRADRSFDTRSRASGTCEDTKVFSDVPATHANYSAVTCLASDPYCTIAGNNLGQFLPNNTITRADAMVFVTKYHTNVLGDWELQTPETVSFSDVPSTHSAFLYIETAKFYGFISGNPDGTFAPNDSWLYSVCLNQAGNLAPCIPAPGPMSRAAFIQTLYDSGMSKNQLATCLEVPNPSPTPPAGASCADTVTFSDVPQATSPYYNSVLCLASNPYCMISGGADGSFAPDATITRADAVVFVVKYHTSVLGDWTLVTPAAASFSDVPTTHYAYSFIETAKANGFISGYEDGTFHPADSWTAGLCLNQSGNLAPCSPAPGAMTRGAFIQTLYNLGQSQGQVSSCAAASPSPTPTPTPTPAPISCAQTSFTDVAADDSWYTPVSCLANTPYCMIAGGVGGTFAPLATIKRVDVAVFITKYHTNVLKDWTLTTPATASFSDVPTTHYAYSFIETAKANGFISGYEDGTFHPDDAWTAGLCFNATNQPVPCSPSPGTTMTRGAFIEALYGSGTASGTITACQTPAPTTAPGKASVTLWLLLQGAPVNAQNLPVAVTLAQGGVEVFNQSVLSSSDANAITSTLVSNIDPGTYDVLVQGWGHLARKISGVVVTEGDRVLDLTQIFLLAGDVNADNIINAQDVGKIMEDYFPDTPEGSNADVNRDGTVNAIDLGFVLENYFLAGDE